ncbi:transaldolase family protein [Demequina sp. NBRC 110052]|uniref:transaldolase family protein n=1 Tax=Demequina sp. NBRC 110052 TaxID=1570341 RepID=UPI000A066F3B|nr:transaldolase family protein [Demequina sp. NBRC 110052]
MNLGYPQLFVDSADQRAAEELFSSGIFHGLTTNPTILHRASATAADLPRIHGWATAAGAREICFQTWGRSLEDMRANAARILDIAPSIVVKTPATRDGYALARELRESGARVLITAVYSATQMMAAQSLGAEYIAPYAGRMRDAGVDERAEIATMVSIAMRAERPTTVLAASLRSVDDVTALLKVGVPAFTVSAELGRRLVEDPRTAEATETFESTIEAWSQPA